MVALEAEALAVEQAPDARRNLFQGAHRLLGQRADLLHPRGDAMPQPRDEAAGIQPPSVAISIAAATGFRNTTGITPSPTVIRSVSASAVAAVETPPARKQSSHNQSSSSPAASAAIANAGSSSGGRSAVKTTPSLVTVVRPRRSADA